jgi:hypothetical protein
MLTANSCAGCGVSAAVEHAAQDGDALGDGGSFNRIIRSGAHRMPIICMLSARA